MTGTSNRNLLVSNKATPEKLHLRHSVDLTLKQRQSSAISRASHATTPGLGSNYNFVKYKRPTARDGHTGLVVRDKYLLIFGGDRHRNPFNDSYILDIQEEFND